ncbi:MAG TPA: glycosyltransferase family 2 protein [Phototrophicaceae bacterium]|nr:glycosyltransferase family 2 protein [Phototrophicaceae bacterium]
MLDLSIILVSWNVADLLATCLDTVFAGLGDLSAEVIVVDSASTDNTSALLRERFPQVILLTQSENIGFTRGNNLALEQSQGRYLLLLNPDTEIIADALPRMIAYLDAHPEVGIVGPYTRNSDGSYQSTRRRFPTLTTAFFESTWLQGIAPKSLLDRFYVNDAPPDQTLEVDWVQGSALMTRREVYEQIGGLDEGYVMYSEELDWCKRAKLAGWRVIYLADAQIVHHGGKSSEQIVARRHIWFQESKLRYFHKYHGALTAQTLRIFLLVSYALQLAVEWAKGMLGHKRSLRQERVRQYWQVLRSGLRVS